MDKPIWLYWETQGNQQEPAYITLCRWTMLHNWKNENLIFVNSQNIEFYLPGIKAKVENIEVDVKGRFDLIKRKFVKHTPNLAVKCDYYRAHLLREYGGIYVDSSTIALKSVSDFFSRLNENKSFLVSQRQSHGKSHYPVSVYGCLPESPIINQYTDALDNILNQKTHLHYNELGAHALSPIVEKNIETATVLNETEIMPITFEDAEKLYLDESVEVLPWLENNVFFKLFNMPFKLSLSELTISELYYHKGLLGKIFRYALPENAFKKFYC